MNNIAVLRTERDGVEFFTIAATGESGMSQSGLARACGKDQSTISRLIEALSGKKSPKALKPSTYKGFAPSGKSSSKNLNLSVDKDLALMQKVSSEWLQPFTGKDLTLMRDHSDSDSKTRNVTIYSAEFCAAVIKHYAYGGSKIAQDFDFSLGVIGLTSYIQSKTGWLPEEFKAAPKEHDKLDEFLSLAKEWEECRIVLDEDGNELDMSESYTFLEEIVFGGFTPDEYMRYHEENQKLDIRSYGKYGDAEGFKIYSESGKIKLFFERNPKIQKRLQPYIDNVHNMLREARTPQAFYRNFERAYGSSPTALFLKS